MIWLQLFLPRIKVLRAVAAFVDRRPAPTSRSASARRFVASSRFGLFLVVLQFEIPLSLLIGQSLQRILALLRLQWLGMNGTLLLYILLLLLVRVHLLVILLIIIRQLLLFIFFNGPRIIGLPLLLGPPSFNQLLFFAFRALSFFQILCHLEDSVLSIFDVVYMPIELLFVRHVEFS